MHNKTSYLIIRLALGLSMFGHGLVRMPKLQKFSEGLVASFENSMLPELLTVPFSYVLPIAELIFGLGVLLGLFTRISAIAIGIVLLSLVFGSTLVENWGAITAQFIHIGFVAYIIHHVKDNSYAIDNVINKN
ncbi:MULTISPECIES: DoxX family protein [Winogradskyella]|uniref:DoxX family protein n=1 Tax=Winogradskyella TaxID=286104 RepID=UPI0015CB0820|nr:MULTISPECIES: DoxX family protein [Winogradskyella]QNK78944.1 DoxX family protein [Winogradskyella sp. PAMC22761]QXP78010.1 DoxX family protein [Winogradskyella sp. HaHa_3_26]